MILYDPSLTINFHDYGIMLPVSPDRKKKILDFLEKDHFPDDNCPVNKGSSLSYPGPALDLAEALAFLEITGDKTIGREDLERVHSREFIDSLYDNTPGKGLEAALLTAFELIDAQGRPNRYEPQIAKKPLTDLFSTILAQAGGTWLACRLALKAGFCYLFDGGMHHARYDSGSGFCLINDVTIAAFKIFAEAFQNSPAPSQKPVELIWIIDLDAHKGDGTAELIKLSRQRGALLDPQQPVSRNGSKKPCILCLSIHMAKGWPLDSESIAAARAGRAPLVPSDVDIGIDSGEEGEYTSRLMQGINELEELSAALGKPDLVLVVDGNDPYEHDELPSSSPLKLSLEQCVERGNYVYRYLTARSIPSAWILSGGYGKRAWEPAAYFLQGIKSKT